MWLPNTQAHTQRNLFGTWFLRCITWAQIILRCVVLFNVSTCVSPEHPSAVTNLTQHTEPGSGSRLGLMQWVLPLGVVSAMTSVCLVIMLAVIVYWRCVRDIKKEVTGGFMSLQTTGVSDSCFTVQCTWTCTALFSTLDWWNVEGTKQTLSIHLVNEIPQA